MQSKLLELFNANINIMIKQHTLFIIQTYMDNGYECFIVGGPIRDLLLGLKPKDIDFATNCPLEITKELFKNVFSTGEDHGTLTIHIDGENYEVTRYRSDISCDGRNATIAFSETFEEDANRRDLTINAIGFNPITKEIKDPTGGLEDFKNSLIKFVGNAADRISEDFLRSIRFVRFMTKLNKFGFTADKDSLYATVNCYNPNVVSVERIYQELDNIFTILKENDYSKGFIVSILNNMNIFNRFIKVASEHYEIIGKIFETYDYFPLVLVLKGDTKTLRLCSEYKKLFDLFEKFIDVDFRNQVCVKDLLEATSGDFNASERVLNYYKIFDKGNYHQSGLITLNTLKNKVGTVDAEPFMISQLAVSGVDLMNVGLKGVEIGNAQRKLLAMVKVDSKLNTKEILLSYL